MPIIFKGNESLAYRDPACFFADGKFHLFFTVSEKCDGYMYNFTAHSESLDLSNFTDPVILTERDLKKNFCSPGNVIKYGEKYRIFLTSYPMPFAYSIRHYADESARLYYIETENFSDFSEPRRLYPKGKDCACEGRMIDPYVLWDGKKYLLFFKQNGVSISESLDLENWSYLGHIEGGENACVISEEKRYVLLHSPENGIGVKVSTDLIHWEDKGVFMPKGDTSDFADGRLTAAFAMPLPQGKSMYKYAVFFHGSRADSPPETHGAASLALCYTNDFESYYF